MDKTFELGPNVATITPTSLWVGKLEVPWTDVLAAGLSYMSHGRGGGKTALLHLAYAKRPTAKRTELLVFLQGEQAKNQEFVTEVRQLLSQRWIGEGSHLAMRKRLGFSNTLVYGIVAGITVVVILAVVLVAVVNSGPKGGGAPTKSQVQRGAR